MSFVCHRNDDNCYNCISDDILRPRILRKLVEQIRANRIQFAQESCLLCGLRCNYS